MRRVMIRVTYPDHGELLTLGEYLDLSPEELAGSLARMDDVTPTVAALSRSERREVATMSLTIWRSLRALTPPEATDDELRAWIDLAVEHDAARRAAAS